MNFLKNEKGIVTIYLIIVFFVLVTLIGVFVDLARIKVAQNQLRGVANAAARSVMADYNTTVKEQFGLFAANTKDYEQDFRKYIKASLAASQGQNFSLLDYHYEGSSLQLSRPIQDKDALKQQILEEMKYSGPIAIITGLAEKFKPLSNLDRLFGEQNSKTKTVGDINNKIGKISEINQQIKLRKKDIREQKTLLDDIEEKIKALTNSPGRTKEEAEQLASLQQSRENLIQHIQDQVGGIKSDLEASKIVRKEIEKEIGPIGQDQSGLLKNTGTDPLSAAVVDSIKGVNTDNMNLLLGYVNEIAGSTDNALAALNSLDLYHQGLNDDIFTSINIDPADEIKDKSETSSFVFTPPKDLTADSKIYSDKFHSIPAFKDISSQSWQTDVGDTGSTGQPYEVMQKLEDVLGLVVDSVNIDKMAVNARNELLINEYVLSHFACLTGGPEKADSDRSEEIEYILYEKNPKLSALAELFQIRFALDTLAYFLLSKPPAPVELVTRTIYAVIMGGIQASLDTYKLLSDGENYVSLAEMTPNNPLHEMDLQLNYRDHLRLLLLLHRDEDGKLQRLAQLIKAKSGLDGSEAFTVLDGKVEVSVKLWFLPLKTFAKIGWGPFGTEIKNGRCYITKSVQFGY